MPQPIHLVIADDHRLMLKAVRMAMEGFDDIEVVGDARTGAELLPLIAAERPDVAVVDIRMPDMDGLTALDRIRARYPDVKVLMFSAVEDRAIVDEALTRGAVGFVGKHADPDELVAAIRGAAEGSLDGAVVGLPDNEELSKAAELGLTERELAVLQAVARGLSNKEIGNEGWVTEQTVKFHLRNVYRKLAVSSRTEASRFALEHGLAHGHRRESAA